MAVGTLPVLIGLAAGILGDTGRPGAPASTTAAAAAAVAPPAVDIGGQQFQVFFGNLHSHTGLSDGSSNPRRAYTHARDAAGLDFLAITEHNHARAPSRLQARPDLYADSLIGVAAEFDVDGEFVALYGQEFSSISSGNHGNVLDVPEVILSSDVPNGDWRALLDTWIPGHLDTSGQTAVVLLNHPATSGSPDTLEYGVDDFAPDAWRTALDAHAQLINMVNGPSHDADGEPGRPSQSEYRRYLSLGFHLGPTADQDNHLENWGSAADTCTGVVAPGLTKTAVMEALRGRRVYATEDRNLRLILQVHGHLMGTRVAAGLPASGSDLEVRLTVQDDDEPTATYQVDVFSGMVGGQQAEAVHSVTVDGDGTHRIAGVPFEGVGQYVFLRLSQDADEDIERDRAWTAPVWLEGGATAPPPAGNSAVTLAVDLVMEEATVTNVGAAPVNLQGWRLLSVRGSQEFIFPTVQLDPGASITVISRPGATAGPGELLWSTPPRRIWNNDGDPGELYDSDGVLVSESGT